MLQSCQAPKDWRLGQSKAPIGVCGQFSVMTSADKHISRALCDVNATQVAKGHLNTLRDGKASLNKQLGLVGSIKQVHAVVSHAEMRIITTFMFLFNACSSLMRTNTSTIAVSLPCSKGNLSSFS